MAATETGSFDRLRSPKLRELDARIVERVRRGVEFMDEHYGPDWAAEHSEEFLSHFDIGDGTHCVLGIVCGGYGKGRAKHNMSMHQAASLGFTLLDNDEEQELWPVLNKAWQVALSDLIPED